MGRGGDRPGGHGDEAGVLTGGAYGPVAGSSGKRVLVELGDRNLAAQFRHAEGVAGRERRRDLEYR